VPLLGSMMHLAHSRVRVKQKVSSNAEQTRRPTLSAPTVFSSLGQMLLVLTVVTGQLLKEFCKYTLDKHVLSKRFC
jgi:hypothetical protein